MDIVGLPPDYSEHMQLLRYGPGQYYRLHHDWIDEQLNALCGPRVFTFFLYLSDVEEGGGTKFPYLKDANGDELVVQPKRGSAVWWPHGFNDNPWRKDDRTHHEAMPIIRGLKKAANYWIHGSDFKRSMAAGCDGRSGVNMNRKWRI
jgi:prolyl 4-hydroxylase